MPAQSTSEAVGDVAKAAVEALAITYTKAGVTPDPLVPVIKRKRPDAPEGGGLPALVVSVGEEGRTEYLTATQKLKRYPVTVTYFAGGGRAAADDPAARKVRERIEQKLEARATWAGLSGWNETNITNPDPFDPLAGSKDYLSVSVVAEVQVVEELP